MKRSILPTSDPVLYVRNKYRTAGTYTRKTPEPAGAPSGAPHTLPAELRRETARAKQIRENVTEVLTTPNRAGTVQIFTGLQPLPELAAGLYYGNEIRLPNGKKTISDALFLFSADGAHLLVLLFPGVHKRLATTRQKFAAEYLDFMRQRMPAPLPAALTLF